MFDRQLEIAAEPGVIVGDLVVPDEVRSVVVFAHGSGSSRRSVRNRQVAEGLQKRGIATLLLDLLSATEGAIDDRTAQLRFDIELLTSRVLLGLAAVADDPTLGRLPVGLFGASTGAAAALLAAARQPDTVGAVVSRGGRPDLAGPQLADVVAPTLLIVGERDDVVVRLKGQAATQLGGRGAVAVVAGATHLFPEPGALEKVTRLAGDWFSEHLHPVIASRADP